MCRAVEIAIFRLITRQKSKMGFTRFVEIGRIALINFGENQGSLCTIVDILDGQKVSRSDWL